MFEPQKLFIGLVDFFAILLPGALLVFLVRDEAANRFFGPNYYYPDGTKGWVIFGFASYLLGHFIFLIGAWGLDKVYDLIRKPTYQEQIKRLADGKRLSCLLPRYASSIFFSKDADSALQRAIRIKEFYLDPIEASSSINAFQWSKARLAFAQPGALADVERFEADSKFFRSLVVLCLLILALLVPLHLIPNRGKVAWITIPVLVLAFWRYVDQRLKSTNQAYRFVIALEGIPESRLRKKSVPAGPSHATGFVFRRREDAVECLLVQVKGAEEWILPGGRIKPAECIKQTAVREVREQSGVWAQVKKDPIRGSKTIDGTVLPTDIYLMEAVDGRLDRLFSNLGFEFNNRVCFEGKRRPAKWMELQTAIRAATDSEKAILESAQKAIK